jgi:hypothetical protein
MWSHPKLKNKYVGNYEYKNPGSSYLPWKRMLRLECKRSTGKTIGKVYVFGNAQAAKNAGWKYSK